MYSAVLVMAMTVGGQSTEFGARGCCCGPVLAACYGGCYSGCHGGCYRGGHHGGCYRGCTGGVYYGCTSGYGCATPVIVGQVVPQTMAPARVVVTLPADARLTFNGADTEAKGDKRSFLTPALSIGQSYAYTVVAEAKSKGGQTFAVTRVVIVRAGETVTVELDPVQSGVAKR